MERDFDVQLSRGIIYMFKKAIYLLFGRPYEKGESLMHKYLRFIYWAAVVFYIIGLPQNLVKLVYTPKLEVVILVLIFPFAFRAMYWVMGISNGIKKEA
jgi:hypothetical protein